MMEINAKKYRPTALAFSNGCRRRTQGIKANYSRCANGLSAIYTLQSNKTQTNWDVDRLIELRCGRLSAVRV